MSNRAPSIDADLSKYARKEYRRVLSHGTGDTYTPTRSRKRTLAYQEVLVMHTSRKGNVFIQELCQNWRWWSLVEFEVRPHECQCMSMCSYLLAHRLDGCRPDILVIISLVRHAHQQAPLDVIDGPLHDLCRGRRSDHRRYGNRGPIRLLVAVRQREHRLQCRGILNSRTWQKWFPLTCHVFPITKRRQDRGMVIWRGTGSGSEHCSGLDIRGDHDGRHPYPVPIKMECPISGDRLGNWSHRSRGGRHMIVAPPVFIERDNQ